MSTVHGDIMVSSPASYYGIRGFESDPENRLYSAVHGFPQSLR
jgi:hypothetical protein